MISKLLKDQKRISMTASFKCLYKDVLRREEQEVTSLFASAKMLSNFLYGQKALEEDYLSSLLN